MISRRFGVFVANNGSVWSLDDANSLFKGVVMMLDLCGRGWQDNTIGKNNSKNSSNTHCLTRASWRKVDGDRDSVWPWFGHGVLQLGGMAHTPVRPEDHGWTAAPTSRPMEGCVSDLRFNGQVRFMWNRIRVSAMLF